MLDLERLAVVPAPGERARQWSSYDRTTRYDRLALSRYIRWAANGDGRGIIREEDGRHVLAEMEGPGVIWRIWSANPRGGHVRIYLDGAAEPALDLPFGDYFTGKEPPLEGEALCYTSAAGRNCCVPIPYQRACKIVADPDWGAYYHFTYTTFPKGTVVPTFTRALGAEAKAALATANAFLAKKLGTDPAGQRQGEATVTKAVSLAGGQAVRVAELTGPRAITALRLQLDLPAAPAEWAPLRELCLRITWDGAPAPQVWSPVGDFFGSAPGLNAYRSLPVGMSGEEMYCLWYMPFGTSAVVELVNEGRRTRTGTMRITHAPLTRPLPLLMRFHAKWHRDAFLPRVKARRIDWPVLTTEGRGRFVGTALHVWNPRGGWWGEGDEKFFVDGEDFPSIFGTGTEDYFGYAYGLPELFARAYHGQTRNDGNNRGHVSCYRWHVADSVPFQDSFEGAIEKVVPNDRSTLYAATAYWYQAPGGEDPYEPVPLAERFGYWRDPPGHQVEGVLEGEHLRVAECSHGRVAAQDMGPRGDDWSGGLQRTWLNAGLGSRLTLLFPVEQAGKYRLVVQLGKSRFGRIVQLGVDGRKLGKPIDLYAAELGVTGPVALGVVELAQGARRLEFEVVGTNPQAELSRAVALDYLRLEPVR